MKTLQSIYDKENLTNEDVSIMGEEQYLLWYKKYNKNKYESPSVTSDIVILTVGSKPAEDVRKLDEKSLEVLMVQRNELPEKDKWSLVGGFLDIDKTLEDNVNKVLEDKMNLKNVYTEQLFTFSDVNRDPRKRILSSAYMTLASKSKFDNIKTNDGISNHKWFTIKIKKIDTHIIINSDDSIVEETMVELTLNSENDTFISKIKHKKTIEGLNTKEDIEIISNSEHIAFDHIKIIYYAVLRLQNKVSYTNLAFNLVDKYFSLTELQSVYELILNKEFHKSDFRRIIKKMVNETDKYDKVKGHRPSKLFQYNPHWTLDLLKDK